MLKCVAGSMEDAAKGLITTSFSGQASHVDLATHDKVRRDVFKSKGSSDAMLCPRPIVFLGKAS